MELKEKTNSEEKNDELAPDAYITAYNFIASGSNGSYG